MLAAVSAALLFQADVRAESTPSGESAYLSVGTGIFGIVDHERKVFGVAEFQPARRIGPFGTWIALMSTDRDHYLAAGLLYHWRPAGRLFVIPSIGAGLYGEDDGTDLGYPVEFRSGIEAGYEFTNGMRLSLAGWHVSNCRIDNWNPGTELLAVRCALPLSKH